MKKIRVLGIAPYEGMRMQMLSLAKEFPEIDLTVHVGDLEEGLFIIQNQFQGEYDIAISRGATASMLKKHLNIPVIEVEISMYDILCAIKLSNGMIEKNAMIFFADIEKSVTSFCELLDCDIDIYPIEKVEDIHDLLESIKQKDYHAIVCDVVVNTAAQKLGLNSFLITSGVDSIRDSFQRALQICNRQNNLYEENQFFMELLQNQKGNTVVFDNNGILCFSTLQKPSDDLIAVLQEEILKNNQEERQITRSINKQLYSIHVKPINKGNSEFIAFFFSSKKLPAPLNQMGITYYNNLEIEKKYYQSIFSFAGIFQSQAWELDSVLQSASPVMISGENGTGKEALSQMLYLQGERNSQPLVTINCTLLNERSWEFLIQHHNSPLADESTTIFFSNIDALSDKQQHQLVAVLIEMDVCRRHRVIFSCLCQKEEHISQAGAFFQNELDCLTVYLPPLRESLQQIPNLVNLCLSHINIVLPQQISGADSEAVLRLQQYHWPHNYRQFRRMIEELALASPSQIITADIVEQFLAKERHTGTFSPQDYEAAPLDLNRTLNEINRDIALRVVNETANNRTVAAKRLGISRTTLWRLLQG